jgi:hypothetical protein
MKQEPEGKNDSSATIVSGSAAYAPTTVSGRAAYAPTTLSPEKQRLSPPSPVSRFFSAS